MGTAVILNRCGGAPLVKFSLNDLQKEFAPQYERPQVHDASHDAELTHLCMAAMLERFDSMVKLANNAVTETLPGRLVHHGRRSAFGRTGR
jgi:hypothetical protein